MESLKADQERRELRRKWTIRWAALVMIGIAGFYIVEDIRGWCALKRAKAEYHAGGKSINIEEILGPAPSEEDNFAEAEFIKDAFRSSGSPRLLEDFPYPEAAWYPPVNDAVGYFEIVGLPENFFPEESQISRQEAAVALLEGFEPAVETFEVIEQASLRKRCRYRRGFAGEETLFHLPSIKKATDNFRLRSVCAYTVGDLEGSVNDFLVACRLVDKMQYDYALVGSTITIAFRSGEIGFLWKYLEERELSLDQLQELKAFLHERSTPIEIIEAGIEMDAAMMIKYIDDANTNRLDGESQVRLALGLSGHGFDFESDLLDSICGVLIGMGEMVAPRGWYWQNQASYLRAMDRKDPSFAPHRYVYDLAPRLFAKPISEARERAMDLQIQSELAIAAINAEIYFRQKEGYPEDMAVFGFSSSQFGYQLGKNGRPIFYYDETNSRSRPLSEVEFDSFPREHVWRYP